MSEANPSPDHPQGHPDGRLSAFQEQPSRPDREPETPEFGDRPSPGDTNPDDLPGETGLRPISVEPERRLRNEAVQEVAGEPQARPWYAVVDEWRSWYDDYRRSHIEYESPDGETTRTRLENSYQPQYGKRYYARFKDLERGIQRRWGDVTTVMLTFSASTLNAEGFPRCPADHMRDVAEGWNTARKRLHKVLGDRTWEYARVWEPTSGDGHGPAGYGHLHVAVFLEDAGDLEAEDFRPVMESYVGECGPAGWEAHRPDPPEGDGAVSLNDDVQNLGSYLSEYVGIFGKEALDRPVSEQAFYAVTWATGTRRVDFSNGAQEIISGEQFRRETGLRPEDRGECGDDAEAPSGGAEAPEDTGWGVTSICTVRRRTPNYADPTVGGVDTEAIEGRSGMDPPADRGEPPGG